MGDAFNIIQIHGKIQTRKNKQADPLSRLLVDTGADSTIRNDTEEYVRWIVAYAEPKAIKIDEIEKACVEDDEIQAVKTALNSGQWIGLSIPFKTFENELCFAGDILLRGTRIIMPTKLRDQTLQLAHEGHPGMTVMKKRLRAKVWWPKMDGSVEEFVKKCRGCLLVSAPSAPEPLKRTTLPTAPWEFIAIDFLGPLPSGHNLLVIIDYYSRYKEVEIMKKLDSFETIKRLKTVFARFGIPKKMRADNGPQLSSAEFNHFCQTNNIELDSTTPWWPQENGEVERQNEKGNWHEDLQSYLLMYRSSPHCTTLKSPAELMFNRNIRDKLPMFEASTGEHADSEVRDRDALMKQKGKEYADRKRHAKPNDVKEGDEVVAKRQIITNKLATKFEPTVYNVIKRSGAEVTIVNPGTGTQYKRNVAHVKKLPPTNTGNGTSSSIAAQPKKPPARKRQAPSYYQDFSMAKLTKK